MLIGVSSHFTRFTCDQWHFLPEENKKVLVSIIEKDNAIESIIFNYVYLVTIYTLMYLPHVNVHHIKSINT